jgi:release factor glutamine methyltransferase
MRIKAYRDLFIRELVPIYGESEAESFFYLTLEKFKQMRRVDLALQPNGELSEVEIIRWNAVLAKLKQEIPIQYILGSAHFYGLEFEVDENVLIPRPETEELVDWILSNNRTMERSNLHILDIGTGSGCIAISLAKNLPDAKVIAIDLSDGAIEIAGKNAVNNDVVVTFLRQNILETERLDGMFDVIVSNPPYVRELEKSEIRKNVLDNEPHLALFVEDDDALLFYRKIADLAKKHLKEKASLYLEINQYLAKETMDLLEQTGFSFIELRKDIYGNHRMIHAKI